MPTCDSYSNKTMHNRNTTYVTDKRLTWIRKPKKKSSDIAATQYIPAYT